MNDPLMMFELSYVVHLHMIRNNILLSDVVDFFSTLHVAPEIVLPICLSTYFPYYLKFYPFGIVNGWCYLQINCAALFLDAFTEAVKADAFAMQEVVHGNSHYACMTDTSCFADFKNVLFVDVMCWFGAFFGSSQPIIALLNLPNASFLLERRKKILKKYTN